MAEVQTFDIVVIGGGSGLTAAHYAGKDGKSVALIEQRSDALGGTCINRGCIPTKGLIQSADVLKTVREAGKFGIHLDQASVRVDFKSIMDTVRDRRRQGADGAKSWVDSAFTPFYGHTRFVDEKILEMEDGTRLTGEKVFIASGARPAIPPISGLDGVDYWTNETVLELSEQPESLLILGAGYVGCEFGHFFATLGTRVTVIDRFDQCLTPEDEDIRTLFTEEFGKKVDLVLGADVREVSRADGQIRVLVGQGGGAERALEAGALLVATGRRPNTDALGLDRTGVETDKNGWVQVDDRLRTTHPDIYAYGDVIGQGMFKHTSSYEGELAYGNSQGGDQAVSYRANPHAVFSDPQIGSVGLTERECKQQGLRYKSAKREYGRFSKGKIMGSPPGLAKVLVESGTDRILGFHMAGPEAADVVHEVVVAMSTADGQADSIRRAIHIHPTLPELIRLVFDDTR